MLRFNDIADRVLEYNPGCDLELLQRAYVFTAKVHEGQERLSGEPYLIHPLEVAGILVDMRMDDVTVAAGMLHDTLEDTLTTREELERIFGEQVAFLVEGLTKIAKIEFSSVRERQAENFRKMLIAMAKDIRILLIKLADRLHNMRTLDHLKESARHRIAQETLEIYVPLAQRLGMHRMKQELETLVFRTLMPDEVARLERKIADGRAEREAYIQEVIGKLRDLVARVGIRAEVSGRLKDLASIHSKMKNQGLELDQIYDMIAFRIIISGEPADCYTILGMVHGEWRPVPGRFKDYIALKKPNGYQSLHTTVIGAYGERMEVQIRTSDMHRAAELGISAHWKYKEGHVDEEASSDAERFAWLGQLVEWQREFEDPHEFLDAVKVDLFPNEVFVFTPQGELVTLPTGSTAVDFAYAIHSEVGDSCVGVRINGQMMPLRTQLEDGDRIEIETKMGQKPRKEWLDFVVSSRARSRIRHSVRMEGRARSRQLGREILEKELKRDMLSLTNLLDTGELAAFAKKDVRGGTVDDLYAAISYGKISASEIVKKLIGEDERERQSLRNLPIQMPEKIRGLFRRGKRDPDSGIRVSGSPDVMVRFGGCCDPLPGDDIIGFVTRGRGVTIHTIDCPRVFELDRERRIEVQWDDEARVPRRIRIRVRSRDHKGILAEITNSISEAEVNIGAATITTDEDNKTAIQNFDIWVTNVDELNAVMKDIRKVKGVLSVERVAG